MTLLTRCVSALVASFLIAAISVASQAATDGAGIATLKGCPVCHGNAGEGQPAAVIPRLAGQSAEYLERQLNAFASGERKNTIMQAQVQGMSPDDMHAVTSYYASMKVPQGFPSDAAAELLRSGREIVVNGIWSKNLPSCISCHGPGVRGLKSFPMISGQGAAYIEAQLKNWQAGTRPPGPVGVMANVAKKLDAAQIHAVAVYISSLPPSGPVPADAQEDVAPAVADAMPGYFQPPRLKDLPGGEFGESVKRGFLIFTQTPKYAADYVGNAQSCSNCHINAGRQANSAPMWAAWGMYPAYRGKNKKVNDMVMRLQGCFRYSENAQGSRNGKFPPGDSQVMIDVESYMYWMSTGVPTGRKMKGRGYAKLAQPPQPFSPERGKQVYAKNCAACHGPQGQGLKLADGSYAFPPLWGAHAFNWGAGMHGVDKAASFIHHNMPLGYAGKLDLQQTWDVASFIDSRPRPQDPRFKDKLEDTVKQFHKKRKVDHYGATVDGRVLGAPGTVETYDASLKSGN